MCKLAAPTNELLLPVILFKFCFFALKKWKKRNFLEQWLETEENVNEFLKSWELFEKVGNFLKKLGTFLKRWELFLILCKILWWTFRVFLTSLLKR
jgi:hypothetical protein